MSFFSNISSMLGLNQEDEQQNASLDSRIQMSGNAQKTGAESVVSENRQDEEFETINLNPFQSSELKESSTAGEEINFNMVDAEHIDTINIAPQVNQSVEAPISKEAQNEIFAKVVDIFNQALPEFISKSINPEKQKALLFDALDDSLKAYLSTLEIRLKKFELAQWEIDKANWSKEKNKLQEEIAQLNLEREKTEIKMDEMLQEQEIQRQECQRQMDEAEAQKNYVMEHQMSWERQKRTLQQRVNDLTDQLAKLEERDHYSLPTSKATGKGAIPQEILDELEDLRSQNYVLKLSAAAYEGNASKSSAAVDSEELANLRHENKAVKDEITAIRVNYRSIKEECATLKEENNTIKDENKYIKEENIRIKEQLNLLKGENETLRNDNEHLSSAIEETKLKDKMSDAMFSDLQKRASDAQHESKTLKDQIESLNNQLWQKDACIADLKQELQDKDLRLTEEESTKEQIEEIQKQVELFEEVKLKMDARVEKIRANLQSALDDNEKLRKTLQQNQLEYQAEYKKLNDQIENLKSGSPVPEELNISLVDPDNVNDDASQSSQATIVDDFLSETDWQVTNTPSHKDKPSDADSQKSLFD